MDEKLTKRARKKFLSTALANSLTKLDSPLNKGYALTHGCQSQIIIDGGGHLSSPYYCKRRWCMSCASIKMATMINQYHKQLDQREDLHFITLTQRTIKADQLNETIDAMGKRFRSILDLARKRGVKINGLRKLECKAAKAGRYHPHYHLLVEGEAAGQFIINQWLKRSTTSKIKGQHIERVWSIDSALIELMKYTTKLTCSEDSSNEVLASPTQMDIIFQSLHGRRLYQPFGDITKVSEDSFNTTNEEVIAKARGLYEWIGHDWYHVEYGQPLSGWMPEGGEIKIYKNISRNKRNHQLFKDAE